MITTTTTIILFYLSLLLGGEKAKAKLRARNGKKNKTARFITDSPLDCRTRKKGGKLIRRYTVLELYRHFYALNQTHTTNRPTPFFYTLSLGHAIIYLGSNLST